MKYDIPLERSKFNEIDRVVRSVLYQSGRADIKQLELITTDVDKLPAYDRGQIEASFDWLGLCMSRPADQFDIWIHPSFQRYNMFSYAEVLLHELCHGYLGLYTHNVKFRRFVGRTLYHYSSLTTEVHTGESDPNLYVQRMIRRYETQHPDESYSRFLDRLEAEQVSIAKSAEAEVDYVGVQYERLSFRER